MRKFPIVRVALAAVAALCVWACGDDEHGGAGVAPGSVEVGRTAHGIVHVRAADYRGAGYGVGYAYAEDNRCLLAHRIAEVNGRLAAQLGADAPVTSEVHDLTYTALQSDHYYRGWFDVDVIRAGFAAGSQEVRDLAAGYADGVNASLAAHPNPDPCEVEFVGSVSVDDVYRMWVATASVASGELVAGFLPHAAPGSGGAAQARSLPDATEVAQALRPRVFGSNAWALGRQATQHAGSVHLYNPHFPWAGPQRLYLLHVTIADELDVMGSALGGFPLPLAGFTQDVAWGLTFSTAARWTAAELKLSGDPRSYVVDGQTKAIAEEMLSIPVRGEATPRQVPFYRAEEGPIIDVPAFLLGWTAATAYAVHDANAANTRTVEQFLRLAQAKTVHEVRDRLAEIQGVPWSYTLASDANGDVFFGDISNAPGLTTSDIQSCVNSSVGQFHILHGIVVLDGSRAACSWSERMPASEQPQVIRSDYVANSNNNFELPHPQARQSGFSPVLGAPNTPLSLRAGLGLAMIADRLAGSDGLAGSGFTLENAQEVFLQERNRAAELLLSEIVDDCRSNPTGQYEGSSVDLTAVCDALAGWDRRNRIDSRGAAVFRGLWMQVQDFGAARLFAVPASLDAPLTTPAGYSSNRAVRTFVRNALARVAVTFAAKGLSADIAWGQVNAVSTPADTYPMPGGLEGEGLFDVIVSSDGFYDFDGWAETLGGNDPETLYGASYLHIVELGADGPRALGLMPYSQATEPSSPWYLDQVENWSSGTWLELPFAREDITADAGFEPQLLSY